MKKTCPLVVTVLMLTAFTCSIAPVNADFVAEPLVHPTTPYPWIGDPGYPVYFEAEVSDPSEVFIIYPPFDWEWRFEKTEGPGYAPEVFTETTTTPEPEWGFDKTFEYCCNYSVEIRVTNDEGWTLKWPIIVFPPIGNYTLITYSPPQARIVEAPSSGETCLDYRFVGDATYGAPPLTYEWDFDYDGDPEHFNVDAEGQEVNWSFNLGKTYTVALRVTDDWERQDIDTCNVRIEAKYILLVEEINGPIVVIQYDQADFDGLIKNYWEDPHKYSPDYTVISWLEKKVWIIWPILYQWVRYGEPINPIDTEYYEPLHGTGTEPFDPDPVTCRETGTHRIYVEILVDGVQLDYATKEFQVINL